MLFFVCTCCSIDLIKRCMIHHDSCGESFDPKLSCIIADYKTVHDSTR